MSYEEELFRFLKKNHPMVEEFQVIYDGTLWPDREKRTIYENTRNQSSIVLAVQGKEKGQVFYREGEEEVLIFEEFLEFVKFLELIRREQLSKNQGLFARIIMCLKKEKTYLQDYKEEQKAEQQKREQEKQYYVENQIREFQERKGFVVEGNKISLWIKKLLSGKNNGAALGEEYLTDNEFPKLILPEQIVIDEKITEKDKITAEFIRQVQKCLYRAEYSRIEITYLSYWERKGRKIPMYHKSLVFLCEDTKTVVYYFNDENLHADVFYDNRDNAGLVDGEWIPEVEFHGQKVSTQNIIYDRKKLNQTLKNMLFHGEIDDDISVDTMDNGYFSIRYFSNKNAYTEYKNTKGEF